MHKRPSISECVSPYTHNKLPAIKLMIETDSKRISFAMTVKYSNKAKEYLKIYDTN